jgi:uncharacterized membrane protein YkoI
MVILCGLNSFVLRLYSAQPGHSGTKAKPGVFSPSGPLARVPTEVLRTIRKTLGNGRFISVEKTTEHGQTLYEVEIFKDEHERVFYVDEKGVLASYEVFPNELPVVVRREMQKHLGSEKSVYIGRIKDEDGTSYEVETRHDGKKKEYTFDDKGAWFALTIHLIDAPPVVRKGFRKVEPEAKLVQVDRINEKGKIYYEFEVIKAGKEVTLWIDSNGTQMADEDANH